MSLDRLLEEATSPADAAEAARLMATATVDDSGATEQERTDARHILDLSWEELVGLFAPPPTNGPAPSVPSGDDDDTWSDVVPDDADLLDDDDYVDVDDDFGDGSTTTINADGSITTVNADGSKGTVWVTQARTFRAPGRDAWVTEYPKVINLGSPVPLEVQSPMIGRKHYGEYTKLTYVVGKSLSAEEIQQIRTSLPDGVELAVTDDIPVRLDGPEQA